MRCEVCNFEIAVELMMEPPNNKLVCTCPICNTTYIIHYDQDRIIRRVVKLGKAKTPLEEFVLYLKNLDNVFKPYFDSK